MAAFRGKQIMNYFLLRKPNHRLAKILSIHASSDSNSPAIPLPYQLPVTSAPVVNPKFPVRPAFQIRLPPKFLMADPEEEVEIQEYFIPVTRSGMVRHLLEERNLLNANEKSKFGEFAAALDHCVGLHFVGVHEELKNLFSPLNPSAELMRTRKMSVRDRLDNEFWLLQKLSVILERANFFEIPSHDVDKITSPRVIDGVKVTVNRDKYAVLRIWAIGRELTDVPIPWYEQMARSVMANYLPRIVIPHRRPQNFLKRVVIAVRLKTDSRIQVKAFRDIPASRLHLVLPDGQFTMSARHKVMIAAAAVTTGAGAFGQLIVSLAGLNLLSPLATAFVSSLVLSRLWFGHKVKCMSHLAEMNRTQFFKNVANGRSLLEALVFRARTESFKEALLTYTFLLAQRPPTTHLQKSGQQQANELGGITQPLLEKMIEAWARRVFNVNLNFDAHASLRFLESLGIVQQEDEFYRVQPLEVALRALPLDSRSLTSEEGDLLEGYDKDIILDDLLKQEQRFKRYGWG